MGEVFISLLRGQRLIVALSVRARRFACSDKVESYAGGSVATGRTDLNRGARTSVPHNDASNYPRFLPILTYPH